MKRDEITVDEIMDELDMAGISPLILNSDIPLDELMDDPSAWLTAGQSVRLGVVFQALGKMLENGGKEMVGKDSIEDYGVKFNYVEPGYKINETKVKTIYPYACLLYTSPSPRDS